MIIRISNDLKKEEIYANGVELASIMGRDRERGRRVLTYPSNKKLYVCTFKNPVLVTDTSKIFSLNSTLRDTLFSLFSSKPRITEYDGIQVYRDESHVNVWDPSIDTIVYAKALRALFKKRKDFKNVIEIGCGSGFLSKYALKKAKIKKIIVNDINPYAIKCARDNIKDKRASFHCCDGLKLIKGKKFDLIICNPPYVPRPGSIEDNPYEGIALLYEMVHFGQNYLNENGVIITNISSLAKDIILKKKPVMRLKFLERMRVPLKVNNILNNKRWLKHLARHGLKKHTFRGYDYWHKINIVMLEKDKSNKN